MGPFRGLLLSFFFISVGLGLDLPRLLQNLPLVFLGAGAILAMKTGLGFLAARLNGWNKPGATQLGFLLAQGSEFSLVILSLAAITTGMPSGTMSAVVAAVGLSLAIAPSWANLGVRFSDYLARISREADPLPTPPQGDRPVIVIGMTSAGRLAIDALSDHDIPYIATNDDPDRFLAAVADGYRVSFGDASNMKLIEAIGGSDARAVVLGFSRPEISRAVTPSLRRNFPGLLRWAAVESLEDLDAYLELNVRAHLLAGEPRGIEMVADMLTTLGVSDKAVSKWIGAEVERFSMGEVHDDDEDDDPADSEVIEETA